MMSMYFILMIFGGMKHPCICTGLGLLYNVSRFFYFNGYSTGDPMNRLTIRISCVNHGRVPRKVLALIPLLKENQFRTIQFQRRIQGQHSSKPLVISSTKRERDNDRDEELIPGQSSCGP